MFRLSSLTCAALAALLATPVMADIPQDMPRRKPGLWEMKTTLVEMGGLTQMLQMCVGANTDDLLYQRGSKQAAASSSRGAATATAAASAPCAG